MKIVEETPRLGIADIRRCKSWPEFQEAGEATLLVEVEGVQHQVIIRLTTDMTGLGTRWWLLCSHPRCRHPRRRYLHLVGGEPMCRDCGGLLYNEQAWPDSNWRVQVGRPALRVWRRQQRAA